jgi:hypothetical protein
MTRIPNRFQFGPETLPGRLPIPAHLKRLKNGDVLVFCDHQFLNRQPCRLEIAKLIRWLGTSADGPPIWQLTGPRGQSALEELAGGILRPHLSEPELTRRPVPTGAQACVPH